MLKDGLRFPFDSTGRAGLRAVHKSRESGAERSDKTRVYQASFCRAPAPILNDARCTFVTARKGRGWRIVARSETAFCLFCVYDRWRRRWFHPAGFSHAGRTLLGSRPALSGRHNELLFPLKTTPACLAQDINRGETAARERGSSGIIASRIYAREDRDLIES